ncbi:MAG: PQQ-binding-like beta-propeller repeat protein [Planctomycetes bacterium]|nr:PQQ-binding-like beta-propeller repeat protein [Planctomycetota bacterium]
MLNALIILATLATPGRGNDWPSWRGPEQTGMTRERAPVTSWSTDGENLVWKVPVGGRTTPIVMDGRLYAITPTGENKHLGERVICLDADTGQTLWEHKFNVFHTDIVEARLGWTAVVGDPETGNVYAHGTGGELFCLSRDGKVLWKQSLGETFARYSGYGGRLQTPIVDEDRLIISYVYILSNWNTGKRKSGHRYVAFNKHTGQVEWWSQPGGKPFDTTYSTPVITVINGRRLLIAGNADGHVYGMSARTGERIWSFKLAKRGLNTSVVVDGKYVYVTHSEENHSTTEMGSVVCLDGSKVGDITDSGVVWRHDGITAGYSSPALANGRLYTVTNSANLLCFDARTGKQYWKHKLGRVMKGSPVVTADGVIYAGEVNGRFLILRDAGDHCEELDVEQFAPRGETVVDINGSPIVANGRVYFMTAYDTYCLGTGERLSQAVTIPPLAPEIAVDSSRPATLHVVPMDVILAPGQQLSFVAKFFDANGRALGTGEAKWSVHGVAGAFIKPGLFVPASDHTYSAGVVRAEAQGLTGEARVRISPPLPIQESFDGMALGTQPPGWIGVDLRTEIIEKDGSRVLHKMAKSPSAPYSRMRSFSGSPVTAGYTVQADLLASPRAGRRPVLSDMGLINSRYKLILLGYEKRLRLVSYSPIPRVQVEEPYEWNGDAWYRAKISVDLQGDTALVRGKVWLREQPEPADWMIQMIDPNPNREGSPGLYAYSKGTRPGKPGSSVFFDNYQVTRNE